MYMNEQDEEYEVLSWTYISLPTWRTAFSVFGFLKYHGEDETINHRGRTNEYKNFELSSYLLFVS